MGSVGCRYSMIRPEIDESPTPVVEMSALLSSEDPTPIHIKSGVYPMYQRAAEEFKKRLKRYKRVDSILMSEALDFYADVFSQWSPQNRPDEKTRQRLVEEFLALCNQVREFCEENTAC